MEPEGSSPHSQTLATCPYPKLALSSPYPHIPIPKDPSSYYPSIYASVFQLVSFPHVSSPKPCIRLSSLQKCYMPRPSQPFRFDHPNNIGWGLQIIKFLIMLFSPFSCYLVPLRPKYSPQRPILKHPEPTFLPQCKRPSFTPVQNNTQHESFEGNTGYKRKMCGK